MEIKQEELEKAEYIILSEHGVGYYKTEDEARREAEHLLHTKRQSLVVISHVTHHVTPPKPDTKPVFREVLSG